jgi:antitoxin YefM
MEITATNARKILFDLIKQAERPGAHIKITHEGTPKVIMMSLEEFDGWMETLEVMSDSELVSSLQRGLKDAEKKKTRSLADVKKRLKL